MLDLSIIMPAFNASKTIARMIDSILAQDYSAFELVVIDDGSTDDTVQIVESYAAKDNRIRIIRQQNTGAYLARWNGVSQTTSTYIAFVDADDVIEPHMYSAMLNTIKKYDLDVVQCEVFGESVNDGSLTVMPTREAVFSDYIKPMVIRGKGSVFVWDKVYNRRVWHVDRIDYRVHQFEDLDINIQVFRNVQTMGILHLGLYHYIIGDGSSVVRFKLRKLYDFAIAIKLRNRYARDYEPCNFWLWQIFWICKNSCNLAKAILKSLL